MSSPGNSLRSVLRRWPVFKGAGGPGIFSVPEPSVKLEISPSPRVYIERERFEKEISGSQVCENEKPLARRKSVRCLKCGCPDCVQLHPEHTECTREGDTQGVIDRCVGAITARGGFLCCGKVSSFLCEGVEE